MIVDYSLFKPYKNLLMQTIAKCETAEQLTVAGIMVEDFQNKFFKITIDDLELTEAMDEINAFMQYKSDSITLSNQ